MLSSSLGTLVKRNYVEFLQNSNELRRLWNAVVSMNTVAEYVALDRLEYAKMSADQLDAEAKKIREHNPVLLDIKTCAETLKHVRKLQGRINTPTSSTTSSTGLLSDQPDTWVINYDSRQYVLADVLRQAFETVSAFPEFVEG